MNVRKIASLFMAVLLLSAFSLTKEKRLDIVFIGDSITHGATLDNPKTEAPPVSAVAWLREQPDIKSVQFSNQGVSGYTTVDFLPAADATFNKVVKATQELHRDRDAQLIFSIMLGANDSAIKGPNGSPVSPASYQTNMKAIIDKLLSLFPESKVIIQYPLWYSPNTYNRSEYLLKGLERLQSYFPQIDSLVKNYQTTHPGRVFSGDKSAFDYFRKNYLTDLTPEKGNAGTFYLHPNKKGAEMLGILWGKAIYAISGK